MDSDNPNSKENVLNAMDLALTGLFKLLKPEEVTEVATILCIALAELNPNIILDVKEKEDGEV